MKYLATILTTFFFAFATSALLEVDFFSKNPVRYTLVVILIIIQVVVGFFYCKTLFLKKQVMAPVKEFIPIKKNHVEKCCCIHCRFFRNQSKDNRTAYEKLDAEIKEQIIHFFKTEKNNSIARIANQFKISISLANTVVEHYLKSIKPSVKYNRSRHT